MPETVALTIDGRASSAPAGITVAAALENAGARVCRTSVAGEPRGVLCAMGICFECRVAVDGVPHRRACMEIVRDGMRDRDDGGAWSFRFRPCRRDGGARVRRRGRRRRAGGRRGGVPRGRERRADGRARRGALAGRTDLPAPRGRGSSRRRASLARAARAHGRGRAAGRGGLRRRRRGRRLEALGRDGGGALRRPRAAPRSRDGSARAFPSFPGLDAAGRHGRGRRPGDGEDRSAARRAHGRRRRIGRPAASRGRDAGEEGRRSRAGRRAGGDGFARAVHRGARRLSRQAARGGAVSVGVLRYAVPHGRLGGGGARPRPARERRPDGRRRALRGRLRPRGGGLRPRAEHGARAPARLRDARRRGRGRRAATDERARRPLRGRAVRRSPAWRSRSPRDRSRGSRPPRVSTTRPIAARWRARARAGAGSPGRCSERSGRGASSRRRFCPTRSSAAAKTRALRALPPARARAKPSSPPARAWGPARAASAARRSRFSSPGIRIPYALRSSRRGWAASSTRNKERA